MSELELFVAPTEFKFKGGGEPGEFDGYGSVYDILDSHGDVITKGAFDASIAEHELKGTLRAMFIEHGPYVGGDPMPCAACQEVKSDDHGLHVKGILLGQDTDRGRLLRDAMEKKAMSGLSIAYQVPPGGARMGKKQGEPRRTLTAVKLRSIDIVTSPSNDRARIQNLKSKLPHLTPEDQDMPPDPILDGLLTAFKAECRRQRLEGTMFVKESLTLREVERILREELNLSRARASDVAIRRFAPLLPRDEGRNSAPTVGKAKLEIMSKALADFSLK